MKVGIFKTADGLDEALRNALKAADWDRHVEGRVFVKPNLCAAEYIPGAVTSPEFLYHLVSLLRDRVPEVVVGESDGFNYPCDEALTKTGVAQIVEKAGGKTINLSKDEPVEVQTPEAIFLKEVHLPKTLIEADSVISVPVMKTHEFTLFTGAIKNLFGCVPNNRRIYLHPHIKEVLFDLLTILKPKIAVMDATTAMEGNGPNRGIPVSMGLVLACSDLLSFDKKSAEIMGIDWKDVDYLSFIDQNLQQVSIEVVGESVDSVKRNFVRPYRDLPVKTQIWVYQSYLLTRLCFGTPLFSALQACLSGYRRINREIRGGKAWTKKYWQDKEEVPVS